MAKAFRQWSHISTGRTKFRHGKEAGHMLVDRETYSGATVDSYVEGQIIHKRAGIATFDFRSLA